MLSETACPHHHSSPELFYYPEQKLYPLNINSPCHSPQPLVTSVLLSVSADLSNGGTSPTAF